MTTAGSSGRGVRLPRTVRRTQLLHAAQHIFVTQGYHGAAMDDIAEQAGVTKPVLYQHFPGKLELYLALIDQHAEDLVNTLRDALTTPGDNKQRVAATIAAYFDYINRDGQSFRLLFESDLTNDLTVRARMDTLTRSCALAIASAIREETLLPEAEAEFLAVALVGMSQVTARYWINSGRPVPRAEAERLVTALSWRGIGGFPRAEAVERAEALHETGSRHEVEQPHGC